MAPTPVVSCAAADGAARVNTAAVSADETLDTDANDVPTMSRVSRDASADADEFLLVGVVVGKDKPLAGWMIAA